MGSPVLGQNRDYYSLKFVLHVFILFYVYDSFFFFYCMYGCVLCTCYETIARSRLPLRGLSALAVCLRHDLHYVAVNWLLVGVELSQLTFTSCCFCFLKPKTKFLL